MSVGSITAPVRGLQPIHLSRLMLTADIMATLTAAALPWSTSLVAIFIVIFLLAFIPTVDVSEFLRSLRRPANLFPVLFFVLSVVGTLWAGDTAWPERFRGIAPVAKLLVIPPLMFHFQRSDRGWWVGVAFFASCCAVMLLSWVMFVEPGIVIAKGKSIGVPVKDYIAQGQEFALCAFAAAGAAVLFLRQKSESLIVPSLLMTAAVAMITNMLFVASSRTVLVCIPVLLVVLAFKYFGRVGVAAILMSAVVVAGLAWAASPYLRQRVGSVPREYTDYLKNNAITSTGERLEFWRKSLKFVKGAPLLGNGTGSTRALFERDASGQTGVSAEIAANPHNQTLYVAIQWGLIGCVILYGMWLVHTLLFLGPGLAAWIGLVAVVENVVSSLFNSHIFDFHQGWIYVLAVGVTGGMVLRQRQETADGGDAAAAPAHEMSSASAAR